MSKIPSRVQGAEPDGRAPRIAPGLHFVATPIGAARDITLKALDILGAADVLAAEDTRTARKLMEIHGVALGDRPLVAYHDHNGPAQRPRLLGYLARGLSLAYVSEAGTPLVADPGYQLCRAAIEAGHPVFAAPGASAALAALTVSGLPSDRFLFAGFAPQTKSARKAWLEEIAAARATMIVYESPRRVHGMLDLLGDTFGDDHQVALCRELTKRFEEVLRGPIGDLRAEIAGRELKGEIVLVVDRVLPVAASAEDLEAALMEALKTMRIKDASAHVAALLDLPRRDVYQAALALRDKS